MSGDSFPIAMPISRFTTEDCEATTLFQELRNPLVKYLVCLGLTSDEAQDVAQDAFLSLHQHLAAGGPRENIRSWVFRVAHNQARNRQQSYDRRFGSPLDATADAVPDRSTPERVVLEKEKFRRLGEAIQLLSETERECLSLRSSGLRYREIGEVLGIATSTVGDTVDRAIRKLAEKCNV